MDRLAGPKLGNAFDGKRRKKGTTLENSKNEKTAKLEEKITILRFTQLLSLVVDSLGLKNKTRLMIAFSSETEQ